MSGCSKCGSIKVTGNEGSRTVRIEDNLACCRDGFRAWCPSLPGCSVQRESGEHALNAIRQAIVWYLASLDRAVPDDLRVVVAGEPAGTGGAPVSFAARF